MRGPLAAGPGPDTGGGRIFCSGDASGAASEKVQAAPAIAALAAQSAFSTVQRVGNKYWDPAAALGKILVNGNPDGIELQTLLDNAVAGITAAGDM